MGKFRLLIVTVCIVLLGVAGAQIGRRRAVMSKGPRALGLLEIAADGRAELVPVTIMVNGEFYDASVYKADPIPMAVQPETVYEGLKSGVSQGLFTVSTGIDQNGWSGVGKWKTTAQIEAEKKQHQERVAALEKKPVEDDAGSGPPRLTRSPEKANSKPSQPSSPPTKPGDSTTKPQSKPSSNQPQASTAPQMSASLAEAEADRPILRREPEGTPHEDTKPDNSPLKGALQIIPAISDAGGPQPRPYTYSMKPEEEQAFLQKMKTMAATAVEQRAKLLSGETVGAKKKKKAVASQTPDFRNVQLKVMDISNSNEAILVLTADATLPGRADLQYSTAVAARQDIYGDLHKIFSQTTDNQHLDVQPRYDFIDAVDVDGDGRGELLFRQVWDSGSGFAVYRVIGDRLWPLFESKPSS